MPTLLHKIGMAVSLDDNRKAQFFRGVVLAAVVVPRALNAGAVPLAEQGKRGSDSGAVLLEAVGQREHAGSVMLEGKDLVRKGGTVGGGNGTHSVSTVTPKSEPVNGKRDKQGDRDTDEVNGFYLMALLLWVSVCAACMGAQSPAEESGHRPS